MNIFCCKCKTNLGYFARRGLCINYLIEYNFANCTINSNDFSKREASTLFWKRKKIYIYIHTVHKADRPDSTLLRFILYFLHFSWNSSKSERLAQKKMRNFTLRKPRVLENLDAPIHLSLFFDTGRFTHLHTTWNLALGVWCSL